MPSGTQDLPPTAPPEYPGSSESAGHPTAALPPYSSADTAPVPLPPEGNPHVGQEPAGSLPPPPASSPLRPPSAAPPAYQWTVPAGHKGQISPIFTVGGEGPDVVGNPTGLEYPYQAYYDHHQQRVFVHQPPAPYYGQRTQTESFSGAIALSCFVALCCGCVFGIVAFILAVVAIKKAPDKPRAAHQLGETSYIVSIVGIIVAIIVVIITCSVIFGQAKIHGCSNYYVYGKCYKYRRLTTYHSCFSFYGGYYAHGYCYTNSLYHG